MRSPTHIFELYRAAVRDAQDATLSTETRNAGAEDATKLRLELDEANIAVQRDAEIGEARSGMDHIIRPTGAATPSSHIAPEMRSLITPNSDVKSYKLDAPDTMFRANEEIWKDTTKTVKAGNLYTGSMYESIVTSLIASSAVLDAGATVISTSHQRDILVPILDSDPVATAGAEKVSATITNPVFSQKTLTTHREDGYMVSTVELMAAAEYEIEAYLGRLAARAIATKVANLIAVGAGTTEPMGLATTATSGLTTASATTVTADEMVSLYQSVALPYRRIGSFIVSDGLYTQMLKWKTADGDYLLRSKDGATETFMGRPLYVEPQMASPAGGTFPALFGDISQFLVRTTGVLFERDDSSMFKEFTVVWRFATWLDSCLADVAAVRKLTMHA